MKMILRSIFVIASKYIKNWIQYRGNLIGISIYFSSIFFYAIIMNPLLNFEGLSFTSYVLLSFAIYNMISFSLFMFNIFHANKEIILTLPILPWIFALGKMMGQLTTSILFSSLLILFILLSQRLLITPYVAFLLFISILFSIIFSFGIGFVMSGIGLRYVSFKYIPSLLQILLLFLCGVLSPISMLPHGVKYISYIIPYTYCIDIIRGLLLDYPTILPFSIEIMLIISLSLMFFVAGKFFLNIIVENVRKNSLIVLR
ncbi:hypothetical protein DRN58_03945 [Thermococci archaeon]|nr:MAG: hypothetical protein DRN58_03945 [Thermococci archaeon]